LCAFAQQHPPTTIAQSTFFNHLISLIGWAVVDDAMELILCHLFSNR
jgi:hypothetical protein